MKFGIGGDPTELFQNLHACLRVGRFDRAAALVRRLTDIYRSDAPEVTEAHNLYLKAMLDALHRVPPEVTMAELQDWFTKEMYGRDVEPNVDTFVTMLRASLEFLEGSARDQSVRRYLDLAKSLGPEVFEAVNSSAEYSESEWDSLVRFQPDIFDEPPTIDEQPNIDFSTPGGRAIAIANGLIPDPALTVKPVPQKGLGLKTLNQALSAFDPVNPVPFPNQMEGSQEEKEKAFAYMRQLRLEESAVEAAIERWRHENEKLQKIGVHGILKSQPMESLMWQWYTKMLPLVEQELKEVKTVLANPIPANVSNNRHIYGPYLELLKPEKLAALSVMSILNDFASAHHFGGSTKLSVVTMTLGNLIETEHNLDVQSKQAPSNWGSKSFARRQLLGKLSRGRYNFNKPPLPKSIEPSDSMVLDKNGCLSFPLHVKTRLGAVLVELLLRSATVLVKREDPKTGQILSSVQPAFSHTSTFEKGKKIGRISLHYQLAEKLEKEPIKGVTGFRLPMVVEPKPWTGIRDGGYYRYPTDVVRGKTCDDAQRTYAISAIEKGDMKQVFAGLDVLGKTPWQINQDVFKVMLQAWNAGEGIGELVPEKLNLQYPPEPPQGAPAKQRMEWSAKMKAIECEIGGYHSKRCFQNFQLETARAYLKETFYYPHSMDFRGRAYPVPPILNHMGSDIARGLLRFAKGKELGIVGLQWLKVHLANLYGFDKASLKEREDFAMEHLSEIYDSATNPLSGNRWWLGAEDPWQCLACCMELRNALDSPDPSRYVSQLPVHQDGTCNGLQHYAALGGDKAGASQVNLEPADRPQDIYTGVAELVRADCAKDAKDGVAAAVLLDGKITRKVVKRTVMTNVYGVTFEGARRQVKDELVDMFSNSKEPPTDYQLSLAAVYVAKKIFKALSSIFNGAHEIQFWLGECAERIATSITAEQIKRLHQVADGDQRLYASKYKQTKMTAVMKKKLKNSLLAYKTSVIWTTPLKMPVVQPYRKTKPSEVQTCLQDITIFEPSASDIVSKRKQLQAFPPNFIHSLDATHMMLSALKCDEMGLTFASVHDSFWTHAADIPHLNYILRDAFVRMHSEDIIGRLAAEFKARYAGSMYLATLKVDSVAAQQILALRHQQRIKPGTPKNTSLASATTDEILVEAKRQKLLSSNKPEERKEGEDMITPASIYEAAKDSTAIVQDCAPSLLGETTAKKAKFIQGKMIGRELSEFEGHAFGASAAEEAEALEELEVDEKEKAADRTVGKDMSALDTASETSEGRKPNNAAQASKEETAESKPKKKNSVKKIQVWLPVTFPPVPKKGDFDVRRLKESAYFFS